MISKVYHFTVHKYNNVFSGCSHVVLLILLIFDQLSIPTTAVTKLQIVFFTPLQVIPQDLDEAFNEADSIVAGGLGKTKVNFSAFLADTYSKLQIPHRPPQPPPHGSPAHQNHQQNHQQN